MKAYIKPDLFFESFELSQNIAVCGWDMTNQTEKTVCSAMGDETQGQFPVSLFTETPRCDVTEGDVDSYCYEPGSGGYGLFNS